jgi:hypothetical protein
MRGQKRKNKDVRTLDTNLANFITEFASGDAQIILNRAWVGERSNTVNQSLKMQPQPRVNGEKNTQKETK